jgi:hypothetical protein
MRSKQTNFSAVALAFPASRRLRFSSCCSWIFFTPRARPSRTPFSAAIASRRTLIVSFQFLHRLREFFIRNHLDPHAIKFGPLVEREVAHRLAERRSRDRCVSRLVDEARLSRV